MIWPGPRAGPSKNLIKKERIFCLQKYKFQKCRNTNYRNTELQITEIQKYKLQKYKNTNYRNTELQITEIPK